MLIIWKMTFGCFFSDANDFVGIEIKNITEEEKKQLQESACI